MSVNTGGEVAALHEWLAFETVARCGSVSRAAEVLSLTQSAVSHRLGKLEARLGEPLLARTGRTVSLTAAGQRYLAGVQPALTRFLQSAQQLRDEDHRVLRLAVAPALGASWLVPRLSAFMQLQAGVTLEVLPLLVVDGATECGWDMLIHYGVEPGERHQRMPLFVDRVLAVAAPALLHTLGGTLSAETLQRRPVLRQTLLSWSDWTQGAFGARLEPRAGVYVDDALSLLELAKAGAGVGLSTATAAQPDLETGALVQAHPHAPAERAYYAELSAAGRFKPAALALLDWLRRCAAAESTPAQGDGPLAAVAPVRTR